MEIDQESQPFIEQFHWLPGRFLFVVFAISCSKRQELQQRATLELGRRFGTYDINCVAVLIGRPESLGVAESADPIELLFDQLRARRLAAEQKETYVKQQETARQLRELNEANAAAAKQAELTQTKIEIEVAANRGSARTRLWHNGFGA